MILSLVIWILVAIGGTALVWKGSGLLEKASERLSIHYGLPDIVQGAIIVAVGSSFPELATVVVSTLIHDTFELGVSAIVGSALFNILIIPALSGLVSKYQLISNRDLVYKESQFYMMAIAVLLLTFSFAVIYHPVPSRDGLLLGEMTRGFALLPLAFYAVYIFIQYQDSIEFVPEVDASYIRPATDWLKLLSALVLILIGVEGLVRSAVNFGEILHTPEFLWGLTIVAAGTSMPDAFVSVRMARKGRSLTSMANVLGSNIFDLLCCIPIGILIAGTATINFSLTAPLMAVLTLATLVLFLMMRTHMVLTRWEAFGLLGFYALFVTWIALESFQTIDILDRIPPQ
jgi:cation:H+ antiporter